MTWRPEERVRSGFVAVGCTALAWALGATDPAPMPFAPSSPRGTCLTPAGAVGRVVDTSGEPVADALLLGPRGEVARSGADGAFVVANAVTGPLTVLGFSEGPFCPPDQGSWTVEVYPSTPLHLVVEAPGGGTVWLRYRKGPPVAVRSGEPWVAALPATHTGLLAYAAGAAPQDIEAGGERELRVRLAPAETIPLVVSSSSGELPPSMSVARNRFDHVQKLAPVAPVAPDGAVDLPADPAAWVVDLAAAPGWALVEPVSLLNLPSGPRYLTPLRLLGQAPDEHHPIRVTPAPPVDIQCTLTPDHRCEPWLGFVFCMQGGRVSVSCYSEPGMILLAGERELAVKTGQTSALVDLSEDAVVDVQLTRPGRLAAVRLDAFTPADRTADCTPDGACRLYGVSPGRWRLIRDPSEDPSDDLYQLDRVADRVVPPGGGTLRWSDPNL